MKFLIDTNILIELEDNKVIKTSFAEFYRRAITNKCEVLYHPEAIPVDISRDKDTKRKSVIISKLNKYQTLSNFGEPTKEFISTFNDNKVNDKIDTKQLFQLHKKFIDFLVTEDIGIHKKSKKIGLVNNVLKISEASRLLDEYFTFKIPQHPILKQHSIRLIESKFNDSFFDSLREDYGKENFNQWLQKCSQQDRKCYSLIVDNKLEALLIYNIESVRNHKIPKIYEDALKICTLKVSNNAFGVKLGELFLNKMLELCINRKINYLYLTVYKKQIHLIKLLETFGFYRSKFKNQQGLAEFRMIKCLDKHKIKIKKNEITAHPFYLDSRGIKKYVIPIQPRFYQTLFKDGSFREPTLFDKTEGSIREIQGNTIVKAYISNSKNRKPKKGDILLFYSSQTSKAIEPYGILESSQLVDDFDELWNIVRNKTVFTEEYLRDYLKEKKILLVITFRLISYLKKSINLEKIKQIDSFKNKIQTITELKEADYLLLYNEGYFDERYIIN